MMQSICRVRSHWGQQQMAPRAGHASHAAAPPLGSRPPPPPPLPLQGRKQTLLSLRPSLQAASRRVSARRQGKLCITAAAFPQRADPRVDPAGVNPRVDPALSSVDEFVGQVTGGLLGDEFKEADRRKLRTVYDFAAWRRHRSSGRYWRHMLGLFQSRTIRWVAAPVAYVMSVALAVALYHAGADAGYLPAVLPELDASASAPFGLTSFALSTLLVLRTNASYTRWDEARKMWGLIVNRSRDITRQGLAYIPARQAELQDMTCRWVVAYSRSLMCHLREDEDLERELRGKLRPDELRCLLAAQHRPNFTLQVLTAIINRAEMPGDDVSPWDPMAYVKASGSYRMDENLTQFSDTTGGCERILRTPVPLAYTRHNSRFLMAWLTLLPFTLWDTCSWGMLPVTALTAFLLLGVKEIGVAIEEPFSILPLEVICDTIEKNVWELHGAHSAQSVAAQQAQQAAVEASTYDVDAIYDVDAAALVSAVVPAATVHANERKGRVVGVSVGV